MKFDRIPTRRKPVKKTLYSRLFNKSKTPRKQRASAAASAPEDIEGTGINISRSLSIIFAIHIVAIGMIFIHKQYLSGRTPMPGVSEATGSKTSNIPAVNNTLPVLSRGDKPYIVKKGDNYAVIAGKFQVDENELRNLNSGADIRAGVVLRIPQGKKIVAETQREVAKIQNQQTQDASERGLVEILPPIADSGAQVIRPTTRQLEEAPRATPVSSARTHTVVSGESIWRISNQYKVSQKEIMTLNNISDPTKLKIGQVLKLP